MSRRCLECVEREPNGDYLVCFQCRKEMNRARQLEQDRLTRQLILDHYGHVCACCGSTQDLQVDHIDGAGGLHRSRLAPEGSGAVRPRNTGGVRNFWAWLVREGFPPGYQILCERCNHSKGRGRKCQLNHAIAAR